MYHIIIVTLILAATLAHANNDTLLKSAMHLGSEPSHQTYGFSVDGANQFNGLQDLGQLPSFSFEQVQENTNTAEFLAFVVAQDAPSIALAAEITSLESDLTNAVYVAFGVMPPYSANVQANYKTTLRTQMQQARADIAAATTLAQLRTATNTLNQRQGIINIVRELRALKPDWSLSELE